MGLTKAQQIARDQELIDFKKHKDDIRDSAKEAKAVIAEAAALAANAIGDAAKIAVNVVNVKNETDHDLLIRLEEGNKYIREAINNLSVNITGQLNALERSKADKKELVELKTEFEALKTEIHTVREERIRKLEDKTFNFWIAFSFAMLAIGALFTVLLLHIKP
jgi:hypothetical protein